VTTNTSRPTILYVVSGDLWAGAEVAIFNLLNRLRHHLELRLVALALNEGTLTQRLRSIGVETHVISESGSSFAKLALSAYGLLKDRSIDIIHSHRYKENLLACLLARPLRARSLVSTVHGLSEPSAHDAPAPARPRLKTRLDYFLLRRRFDRVVAVSAEMKRVLERSHGFPDARVAIIHNGIPLPAAAPRGTLRSARLHIGSVGRLEPVKRFDLFLAVAARIRTEINDVRFSILGDGPQRKELVARARALKLDDCIEFRPASPDPVQYYRSLDLYLNTSLHEGLPLSILEAMACATPVVAPRVGGIPEIVSDGAEGLLVESSDPQDFTRSCLSVLTNSWLRSAMGERARRTVAAHFRDTQMAEAYGDLYLELFERSAATPAGQVRRRVVTAAQRS
jgi:glycosyltransferase involved in cell wall biosynthesis